MEIRSNHVLGPIHDDLIKENRTDFINNTRAPSRPCLYTAQYMLMVHVVLASPSPLPTPPGHGPLLQAPHRCWMPYVIYAYI